MNPRNRELVEARPWLAWIERALSTRVQFICWGDDDDRLPIVVGTPRIPINGMLLETVEHYRNSLPPDSVAPGTPHPVGQALRTALGGVSAVVRVGSRDLPVGVLVLASRGIPFTTEELALAAVAAQRIAEALAQTTLQQRVHEGELQRIRALYERDAFIDFAQGLARAKGTDDVARLLLLFAMGLTTATGGYVALGESGQDTRIVAVRGQVLVADAQTVRECVGSQQPAFPAGGLIIPFCAGRQAMGHLVLGGRLVGAAFGPDDAPMLEAAAGQAGMALENARLRAGGRVTA